MYKLRCKPNQLARILPNTEPWLQEHIGKVINTLELFDGGAQQCKCGAPAWTYVPPTLEGFVTIGFAPGMAITRRGKILAITDCCLEPIEDGDPNTADLELLKIPAQQERLKEKV